MQKPLTQIKDLKIALKDLEKYIKDPRYLRVGRKFSNFSLLPREILGNWLLCAVARFETGMDLTLSEDPEDGDGMIVDKNTPTRRALLEHIFINHLAEGELNQLIITAIESKSKKGEQYAQGRILVVFSEKKGMVYPSQIRRDIRENKVFGSIYLIALEKSGNDEYVYWVTPLRTTNPVLRVHKVFIEPDFTGWRVELFEEIKNSYGYN